MYDLNRALAEKYHASHPTVAFTVADAGTGKGIEAAIAGTVDVAAVTRALRYENRALANKDFDNDKKDAGELGSGQSVTALYEIVLARGAGRGQLATINLRYKEPGASTSQLISAVANDEGKSAYEASPDTQFAAAVAELGMLLRNSKHKGRASLADVAALTRAMQGEDLEGYRKELIGLADSSRAFIDPQRLYSAAASSP